jgi:hypothetical protein
VGSPERDTQITRGKSSLTRAVRTGVVAVRTGVGQHRFLQSFGAARSKASGQATNRLRMVSERSSRVLVLEFLTASHSDGPCVRPDARSSLALFFIFCSRILANP